MANLTPPFVASNHLSLALKIRDGKYERVPELYSEELMRVITWMIKKDPKERPSVEDLLNLPNVSIRLREKNMKKHMSQIDKVSKELEKKQKELDQKQRELD